jgi:hypothetical protein
MRPNASTQSCGPIGRTSLKLFNAVFALALRVHPWLIQCLRKRARLEPEKQRLDFA